MERKVYFWEQNKYFLLTSGGFKMRIAICDIDKNFLTKIKNQIYKYAEFHRFEIVADCFLSGESVLKNPYAYNLIFLGYGLAGINGFETAMRLREKNINTTIVFISDFVDLVYDAFKVNAFRFLQKNNCEELLFTVLDDYFKKIGKECPLWVKSGQDIICLNTDEIYYLEADNKHCFIHLKDDTIACNHTMAKVYGTLPKNCFSKTNRAFVVNLNHISRYNNESITLKNNKVIYPSRKYYKTFKEDYRRFLRPYEL